MKLTMPDSLYLIASDDTTGKRLASEGFKYAMSVAVLFELTLQNKVNLGNETLTVNDSKPTGDPLLDFALKKITDDKKKRSFQHWVEKLVSATSDKKMLSRLTGAGDLAEEERSFLLFFKIKKYPGTVSSRETARIRTLKDSAFSPDRCTPRDAMLLALLAPLGLLKVVFSTFELSRYEKEIESITCGDAYTAVVGELVKRDQMLVAAAMVVVVVVT